MSREDELRAELTRTHAEMLALLAVNQTLRVSRDLTALYRVVGAQLANVIPFDSFFIGTYLPETNQISYDYSLDEGVADDEPVLVSLDQALLSARIIRERQSIRIDDLDTTRQTMILTPFGQTEKRSRSWLGAPLITGDEVQGVLAIQSYRPAAFSDADADLLLLLASQVSVAVENARLVARLKYTIAELSAPLIAAAEGVLVLPLIGSVDAERAGRILEQTLDAIITRQPDTLLIDINGVAAVDDFVLDQVMKLVRAVALLGVRSAIVGGGAALAPALARLGREQRTPRTFGDLRGALATLTRESP